jgi:centractin
MQCYVAPHGEHEQPKQLAKEDKNVSGYHLPDGEQIQIGSEKFRAPEILFSPDKIGLEWPGIHEMVVNSVKSCDIDIRKSMY